MTCTVLPGFVVQPGAGKVAWGRARATASTCTSKGQPQLLSGWHIQALLDRISPSTIPGPPQDQNVALALLCQRKASPVCSTGAAAAGTEPGLELQTSKVSAAAGSGG